MPQVKQIMRSLSATLVYSAVALPTAYLTVNAVLALSPDFEREDSFVQAFSRASASIQVLATVGGLASLGVLSLMNRLFLLPSLRSVGQLGLDSLPCSHHIGRFRGTEAHSQIHVGFRWLAFIVAFMTSLIFAEIGGQGMKSFGSVAEGVGFADSLLVYFVTRYSSILKASEGILPLKWGYQEISDGGTLEGQQSAPRSSVGGQPESKNEIALQSLDKRLVVVNCSIAVILVLPKMLAYTPLAVQGFEALFQTEVGIRSDYCNAASFLLGFTLTMPTLCFYFLGLNSLFRNVNEFTQLCNTDYVDKPKQQVRAAIGVLACFAVAAGFKYAIGEVENTGAYDYLGDGKEALPWFSLVTVGLLLSSYIQGIQNSSIKMKYNLSLTAR